MEKETVAATSNALPPIIGRCSHCQTVIFASHPYSWCVRCSEPLPYRVNMARRPIMYEKFKVSPFDFGRTENRPSSDH
jgi:hypothetical protein